MQGALEVRRRRRRAGILLFAGRRGPAGSRDRAPAGQAHESIERLSRDQTILIETIALFIRYQLSITPPLPDAHQEAARAQGKARFQQFIEQLARHLQRGGSS